MATTNGDEMTKQELEELGLSKLAELASKNAVGVGFCPGEFVIWIYGKSPANIQVVRKAVGYKLWRHNCGLCGNRFAPRDVRFLGGNDLPNLSKSYCLGCVTAAIWYMKYRFNVVNEGGHARAEEFESKLLEEIDKLSP